MLRELMLAHRLLGPRRILRNAATFKQARASIRGYVTVICYWTLMRIGWMDELGDKGSVRIDAFCESRGLDREMLGYVIRYLVRRDHFEERDGAVRFNRRGQIHWQAVAPTFSIFSAYQPFYHNLERLVRGELVRADLQRVDDALASGFRDTGAGFTFRILEQLLSELEPDGMVELGCGNIDLSLYVSERHSGMRFVGIDNDRRFLDEAEKTIASHGLSDRVTLLEHDLFELKADTFDFSPYPLVTAIDLFHGYYFEGRERLLEFFRAMRSTFQTQRFLVSEMYLADEDTMRRIAYPMIEHELFHGLTGQRTFREGELEGLLEEAGFTIRERWPMRNLAARIFLLFE